MRVCLLPLIMSPVFVAYLYLLQPNASLTVLARMATLVNFNYVFSPAVAVQSSTETYTVYLLLSCVEVQD